MHFFIKEKRRNNNFPNKKPVLIPVIDEVMDEVNIDGGYVIITPLKGLIDDEV